MSSDNMSDQFLETEEKQHSPHTTGKPGKLHASSSAGDQDAASAPRSLPYTFAEHAWALRDLRKQGINPSNATILEAIGKRREALASGNEPEAAASVPVVQVVEVPQPAVNSLAEPYDQLAEQGLFEREIIRQEEFLADAREWNYYLLARVDALMEEILDLQQRSGLLETEDENGNPPEEEAEVMVAPVDSSPVEDASATEPVPPPPSVDWEKLLRESEGQRQDLEAQLEELKVEHVLNQSLERVIEEQRLSLESSGQRIEALTRQLDEAGHLKVRAEQLHAELLEARSSLEAYRDHESGWRTNQSQQEALRARAEAELEKLRNALEQEQFELGRLRGENDHFARLLETERGRLHAEQSRSAALISQLNRQLDEEREIRRQQEKDHASEVQQLCFQLEQERREYETAQQESSETIAGLDREIENLQQVVAAARASSIPAGSLHEAESKLKQAEARAAAAHRALDDLRTESEARIARLEATIAELEPLGEELRQVREENSALEEQLAGSRADLHRLEGLRSNLQTRISALESEKEAAEAGLFQSHQKSKQAISLAEATAEARQKEINDLRKESQSLETELAALRETEAALRLALETHEKQSLELRSILASTEARLQEEAGIQTHEELRRQLHEHREALTDARTQNHHLLERLEGTVNAFAETSRPPLRLQLLRPVLSAIIFLVLVGAAGYGVWQWAPHWIPSVEEMQKSAETFDRLKEQNSQLAAELNATLERLQGAKQEEVTLAEMRALRERLLAAEAAVAQFEREAPANLARMTKLQSELDLARSRLDRISTELTNRDLRILELERLLGEAGAAVLQLPPAPRLTLSAPTIEATLPGMPGLPEIGSSSSELGEVAADSLRSLQRQAEEAWKAKNYGLAEVLFQRLTEAAPGNGLAFSNLAAVQLDLGKLSLAKTNIRRAISLEPRDAFSHTTHGIVLLRSGETEAAQQAFLQALELDPKSSDAFHYLGVAFDQQGNRARAIEEVEKAVHLAPGYAEAHFNLAVLYSQGGADEREKARNHYRKALELGADSDSGLDQLLP
jgi:Flp pilus assembly protein TadD/uncharacterized protein YggL (DUF469 family)